MSDEKVLFYAGRMGEEPSRIFTICSCGSLVIQCISRITRNISGTRRIILEVSLVTIIMYMLIWKDFVYIAPLLASCAFYQKGNPQLRAQNGRSPSLAIGKLTVLLMTCVCIIFVDFPAFPVRHGKVSHSVFARRMVLNDMNEGVHVSLMDTGAALFVILNGFSQISFRRCLKKGVINVMLWAARAVITTSTGYFVPEGEYARHCNFFGYIGAVYLAAALISLLKVRSSYVSIIAAVVHQVSGCRIPFLGYLTLYFMSNAMGYATCSNNYYSALVSFLPVVLSELEMLHPLRETANTDFALYCFSILYFTLFITENSGLTYSELSEGYLAIDRYPLFFFGIANVVTGIANMLIDCNHSDDVIAFVITVSVLVISWTSTIVLFKFTQNKLYV